MKNNANTSYELVACVKFAANWQLQMDGSNYYVALRTYYS